MDKDTRKVLKEAERQGFTVEQTRKNHFRVRTPDGQVAAVLAGTGSDVRGLRNAISMLRRHGFVWPPPRR